MIINKVGALMISEDSLFQWSVKNLTTFITMMLINFQSITSSGVRVHCIYTQLWGSAKLLISKLVSIIIIIQQRHTDTHTQHTVNKHTHNQKIKKNTQHQITTGRKKN